MSNPGIKWFKHGIAWNVKFTGIDKYNNMFKNRIIIIEYEDDRKEAVRVAVDEISRCGYSNVTIDHIVRCS